MVRILVTGFEPFGDHKTNISMDILENVPEILTISDPWRNYRDKKLSNQQIFVEKMVLTVLMVLMELMEFQQESNLNM